MQLVTILALQFVLMLLGWMTAVLLGVKDQIEAWGVSYLLGSSMASLAFLLLHWFFGFHLDALNLFLVVLGCFLIQASLIVILKKKVPSVRVIAAVKRELVNHSLLERTVFAIMGLLVTYGLIENFFWPITDWDALALYDFRARVIAHSGSLLEGIELGYFFQYPPYTSFLHVFGYVLNASRVKVAYSFIYVSLLVTFYALLRRNLGRTISSLSTLILATSPMVFQHSVMAYSNLPYVAFFSLGILYLWLYLDSASLKDLLLGGLLVGLSTWVRSTEPFWLAALGLLVWGFLKHRAYLIPSVALAFWLNFPDRLWRSFLQHLNTLTPLKILEAESHSTSAIRDFLVQNMTAVALLQRLWEVGWYLAVTLAPDFLLLFCLFLLTCFNSPRRKLVEIITLLALLGIVFGGTLIFSFTFETWNLIGGSIVRMCMIFIPLLLFVITKDLHHEKK